MNPLPTVSTYEALYRSSAQFGVSSQMILRDGPLAGATVIVANTDFTSQSYSRDEIRG